MVATLSLGYTTVVSATSRGMLLRQEINKKLEQSKLVLKLGTIHPN